MAQPAQWWLLGLLLCLALLLPGSSAADGTTVYGPVDVCPVNSLHKSLPFLKAAKPDALDGLLPTNMAAGFSINMAAVTDFVKTTLVPLIGANVFFFALAILLLLIFLVWRLFRWCCVVCCCRGSCDLKRAKNDPGEILFGKRMTVNKGFMFVLGLVAVAFAVYGLVTVEKSVTDGAFNVLARIRDYAGGAFDTLDQLLDTIGGTSDIITDFQLIVTVDINVDAITTNMTAIGTFLDTAPTPTVMLASINAMTTRVDDLRTALTALDDAIKPGGTFTAAVQNPAWATTYNTIKDAGASGADAIGATAGGMKAKATNVQTRIAALTTPTPLNAEVDALKTDLDTMYNDLLATHWATTLDTLTSALTNGVSTGNPFTSLKTKITDMQTIANDILNARYNNLYTNINSLTTQYIAVEPVMAGLLSKMVDINSTILVLPAAMQDAYTKLYDAKSKLDTVMFTPPTPTTLLADVTSAKNSMPDPSLLDNLVTGMTSLQNALWASYPPATTDGYLTWIATAARPAVTALAGTNGAALPGSPLGQLKAAVDAYITGPPAYNGPSWAAAVAPNVAAVTPLLSTLLGGSALGSAAALATVNSYSSNAAVSAAAPPAAGSVSTGTAGTFITNTRTALNAMPATASLTSNLGGVSTAYTDLGPTPSAIVNGPKSQLQTIKTAAITSGDNVKAQVSQTVSTFRGSTASIKDMVVTQLTDIQAKYQEPAKIYDGYRYTASMALYGVSILFVVLVLGACLANYQFGANISTFLLLLITVLYFLLAVIIALLISVLYMGCNELEPLALRLAPAQVAPLLKYYFYAQGDSVEAVLRDANLVDIGAVRTQITDSKQDVLQSLTGNFTWVDNPAAVRNPYRLIGRINSTIDTAVSEVDLLLDKAGRTQLFGVYSDVKAYMCCGVPDMLTPLWTGLTMAGVFALALIFATFFFVGKLDRVPRKDCCGCTCHTRSKYAGSVGPDGGAGNAAMPQYASPGWEHPMGPYATPLNGAVAVQMPWAGMEEHASVNVMVGGPMHKAKAG